MYGWMDGWVGGWVDGWMGGWVRTGNIASSDRVESGSELFNKLNIKS